MANPKIRPVPADFATVAPTMSITKLAAHYRASDSKVKAWIKESGAGRPSGKGVLKVLPDNIEALAEGHCLFSLSKVLGWSDCAVARQLKRHKPALYEALRYHGKKTSAVGRFPPPPMPKAPIPADFNDMCRSMSKTQLVAHYGRSMRLISRWIDESPAYVKAWVAENGKRACSLAGKRGGVKPRQKPDVGERVVKLRAPRSPAGQRNPLPTQAAAVTDADKAMRWLQRYGPCYPMRIHVKALDDYMIFGRRMPASAVVDEAKRRGWNPDAWRQVA